MPFELLCEGVWDYHHSQHYWSDKCVILLLSLQNESLYNAAEKGDVEWARKCISDGANVNYQDMVSYDVYHIEGSVVNEQSTVHALHITF